MGADEPYQRDEHKIGKHTPGAQDHGAAQSDHVAQPQNEADRIEAENHARTVRQRAKQGQELKIDELLPNLKGGHKQVINARNGRGLEQQLRLRSAFLAGDQHFRDGSRFGVGKQAVHVPHKIAP